MKPQRPIGAEIRLFQVVKGLNLRIHRLFADAENFFPHRLPRALSTRRCRPPPNWRLLSGRKSGTIRLAGYS